MKEDKSIMIWVEKKTHGVGETVERTGVKFTMGIPQQAAIWPVRDWILSLDFWRHLHTHGIYSYNFTHTHTRTNSTFKREET